MQLKPTATATERATGDWLVKDGAINYDMTYKVGAAEWNGMVLEAAHRCCSSFEYVQSIFFAKNDYTVVKLTCSSIPAAKKYKHSPPYSSW